MFTVISDNFIYPKGTVLTEDQLEGCKIDALIAGGHLTAAAAPADKSPASPEEE